MNKALIILRVIICLWIVSSAITSYPQEAYKFEMMWGSRGAGDGQFNAPVGVVVDPAGNVYIADSRNNRVQKFDSRGNFMIQWGSSSFVHDYPQSVAIDSSGNMCVLGDDNTLQKFDLGGNLITSSILSIPLNLLCLGQIAVDSSGNIYATAHYCCNVACCFVTCPGELPEPDRFGILKFDLNGNLIAKWGDWGTGDGQLNDPQGIAIGSSEHFYVADRGNNPKANRIFLTKLNPPCQGERKRQLFKRWPRI